MFPACIDDAELTALYEEKKRHAKTALREGGNAMTLAGTCARIGAEMLLLRREMERRKHDTGKGE